MLRHTILEPVLYNDSDWSELVKNKVLKLTYIYKNMNETENIKMTKKIKLYVLNNNMYYV